MFCTYIQQCNSTFNVSVYAPYYTTQFVCHNDYAGKDGQCQYSSPGLEAKIPREAMDSTLCKLSMLVRTDKAACNKHSWVWFFDNMRYFWPGTREIGIRRCGFARFVCCLVRPTVVKSLAFVLTKLILSCS